MKIKVWNKDMSIEDTKDLAYWERNMLALRYAQGWYYDYVPSDLENCGGSIPRYEGWGRVLSLENGSITFHIPDDFDVGNLKQIDPNWDGHTTEQKWTSVMNFCGIYS